jgi:hypothetical protein
MNNINVVIMGTFKSGTNSLHETFINNDIISTRIHLEPLIDNTYYFIPIRNQKEIYLSAYFQDIHQPSYEYSLLNYLNVKLDKTKIHDVEYLKNIYMKLKKDKYFYEHLYKNFIEKKWEKYEHLSNSHILKIINNIDKSFIKIPFKKNNYTIHNIIDKNIKIIFLDIKIISNSSVLNNIFTELKLPYHIKNIYFSNIGSYKFYNEDYKYLIDRLKSKHYFDDDYYDFLNDNIYDVN